MKRFLGKTAIGAAVFFTTLTLLWLALFLSSLIPNEAIRVNMEKSVYSYADRPAFAFTQGNRLNSVADHYADAIWLNVAWNMGRGEPLRACVQTQYYDGEELGENAGLYYSVMENAEPNVDYTRYWHGTALVIRLLSLFTTVEGMKIIGFAVFLLLVAVSLALLLRLGHRDLAAALALSLAAVQIWNIRLSLEYQPAFIVTFALLPFYLLLERKNDDWLAVLSIVGGTAVAFFDFLTTETVTVLLPLILVTAVRAKENRPIKAALLLKCGICWGCAYAGTFLVKWTAAALVSHTDTFSAALASVQERTGSTPADFIEPAVSFLSAPLANLAVLFGGAYRVDHGRVFTGIAVSLLVLLSVWYLLRNKTQKSASAVLMLAVGSIVLLRFLLLNNHSYLHCFFTYRSLVSLIFALLAALCLNIGLPQKKKRGR